RRRCARNVEMPCAIPRQLVPLFGRGKLETGGRTLSQLEPRRRPAVAPWMRGTTAGADRADGVRRGPCRGRRSRARRQAARKFPRSLPSTQTACLLKMIGVFICARIGYRIVSLETVPMKKGCIGSDLSIHGDFGALAPSGAPKSPVNS